MLLIKLNTKYNTCIHILCIRWSTELNDNNYYRRLWSISASEILSQT